MSRELDTILWRTQYPWTALCELAECVLKRWNTATQFIVSVDDRERLWTVRHASSAQPFFILKEENLRGTIPRTGNPMPILLLFGMIMEEPGCVDLTFGNGNELDPAKFDLADLPTFLPMATHPAHKKLAELALKAGM